MNNEEAHRDSCDHRLLDPVCRCVAAARHKGGTTRPNTNARRSCRRFCTGGKARFTTKKYVVEFEIVESTLVVLRMHTLRYEKEVAMSGFPDFNGDGHVDGRDYFVWNELNNGSSNRPPSGSNSGCGCSTAFILLLVVGVAVIAGKLFGI